MDDQKTIAKNIDYKELIKIKCQNKKVNEIFYQS